MKKKSFFIFAIILNNVTIKLIDTFGEKCKPDQVNNDGYTALIFASQNNMENATSKLIDTFGEKCKPEQVNKDEYTALSYAIHNNMNDMVLKLKSLMDNR